MCGIAGIIGRKPFVDRDLTISILSNMGDQLAHRGPDDYQICIEDKTAITFRRLSIVDVENGRQPFFNVDESIVLMINGEIYNHQELKLKLKLPHHVSSRSDCEIVLHLYEEMGVDCLPLLNGIFSLMIWDKRKQKIILARDRLGVKPLYFSQTPNNFLFASEVKALLCHPECPRELDWHSALSYKSQATCVGRNQTLSSFFQGIDHVEGGGVIEIDLINHACTKRKYWTLPEPISSAEFDRAFFVSRYRELLEDSVRMQLMSDVEIGIFLSGGIDSVVLSFLASKYQKLHTFTVLSQSTLGNGDAHAAHEASKFLSLPNHQVLFEWHNMDINAQFWKKLLWLLETPFTNAEQLYKYHLHQYARTIRTDLKVILLGQGSDEFNGGYSVSWQNETGTAKGSPTWEGFFAMLDRFESEETLQGDLSYLNRYCFSFGKPLLTKEYLAAGSAYSRARNPWQFYLKRNINQLQMYNLWHEDRTASGNSIESRVPYLDHRIPEFIQTIPESLHKDLFWNKQILREAFAGELPEHLLAREKVPFFNGKDIRYTHRMIFRMLAENNASLVQEVLEDARTSEILDRDAVWKSFHNLGNDPAYRGVDIILELVNMAQLDIMSRSAQAPVAPRFGVDLPELPIENWQHQVEDIELKLGTRRSVINGKTVLRFPGNIRLIRTHAPSEIWYIAVNNVLKYSFNLPEQESWLKVLMEIDGRKNLDDILDTVKVAEHQIRKDLEEALDYDILVPVECPVN